MKKVLGILVPVDAVERILRALRRLRLIDNSFELVRTNEAILIPLLRSPSDQEMPKLIEQSRDVKIQEALFKKATRKPRDLLDAVQGQVPDDLISKLPRSFDVIGDIAVLELPDELNQFLVTIGNGILALNPNLRLVLRKSSDISGTFRTRKFEVIAGVGSTKTVYREFSCRFHIDVAAVYFSPRLSHERMRVAQQVRQSECVVDMFAGVGPYSILIAKLQPQSKVYSIDINPHALKYLKENILLNKVADRIIPMLGDARELATRQLQGVASRVIMNLPSEARNYLDTALKVLKNEGGTIHYYTFASRDQSVPAIQDSFRSAVESLGRKVQSFTFGKAIKEIAPSRVQVAIDATVN